MGTRGRKSKNDLQAVQATSVERLPPPAALTDVMKFEWLRIVNEFPADYFNSGQVSMLKQYVKHVVNADVISGEIEEMMQDKDNFDWPLYDKLLKMQERETRAIASLGIRLGFAKSAHREQGAKPSGTRQPWK